MMTDKIQGKSAKTNVYQYLINIIQNSFKIKGSQSFFRPIAHKQIIFKDANPMFDKHIHMNVLLSNDTKTVHVQYLWKYLQISIFIILYCL